jgi:chloride channel 7
VVGLIAACILYISRLLQSLKYSLTNTFITYEQNSTVPTGTALIIFIIVSTMYGILATIGPSFYEPMACGSGIPEIKCILNGIDMPKVLDIRTLFIKVSGLIFSVSAGLPVGREGPMIHSGAIVASALVNGPSTVSWENHLPSWMKPTGKFLHHFFQSSWFVHQEYQNDREKRDIVACGTSAGVAAAFGAPLGGVLFAIEEGASFWTRSLTWRSFFSAMVAAYTVDFFI